MSDNNITEFKDPNVVVRHYKENPEFYNALRDESLAAWETVFLSLKNKDLIKDKDSLQALSGLISCCIQFMTSAAGEEKTISLLNEHIRRLKTINKENKD